MEIKQEGRQFNPRVAVVQTGTNLMFPNMDAVYHNVFSNSPRNSFDLGTYQAGDKARSVTVTGPGVVDIFCNIHQKMSAKVLVVPSVLYAKVHPDGTFRHRKRPARRPAPGGLEPRDEGGVAEGRRERPHHRGLVHAGARGRVRPRQQVRPGLWIVP